MDTRRWIAALLLAMFVFYSALAVARVTSTMLQEDGAPGWDPIACWDCQTTGEKVCPIVLGYALGALVGLVGVNRRRFARLDARESVLHLS